MVHRLRTRRGLRGAIAIVASLALVASVAAMALAGTSGRTITGSQTVAAGGQATFTVEYDSSGSHYYHVTATVTGGAAGVSVTPATSTCVHYNGGNNHDVVLTVATIAGTTPPATYTLSAVLSEYDWNDNDCNGTVSDTHTLTSTLVVNKAVPTFTLSPIADQTYGVAPFNAVANKSAGDTGAVSFTTGPGSHGCTVDPSTGLVTVTGTTTGGQRCIISASLAADAFYAAAGPVTQQFRINAGAPAFTFDLSALPAKAYGDPTFSVASYASKPADDGRDHLRRHSRQPWLQRHRRRRRDDHRHRDRYQLLRDHSLARGERQLPRGRPAHPAVPHQPRHPCLHAIAHRRQDVRRCSVQCRGQQARR